VYLCRWSNYPDDILRIQGPAAVQQYLQMKFKKYTVCKVKINDKHFEVVIRQMMRKVRVQDPGDTLFLEDQLIHTKDFIVQKHKYGMKVIEDAGDSANLKEGQIVSPRELRESLYRNVTIKNI
jgi:DNA-directed RNA polymerase subunit beta'